MARLIAPNGATVNVSDEKAERLTSDGYKPSEKAPPKKTAAPRKAAQSADKSE